MFKGFYNLTSGMLSQTRRLDVVGNNMVNVGTTGYRSDRYTDSTFQEVMMSRVGNRDKRGAEEIGQTSHILAPSQLYTNYEQGSLDKTGMPLNFAIEGDGFFAVEADDGVAYTRSGSFALDEEGYLGMPGQGRVLDTNGNPIALLTDKIKTVGYGELYTELGGFLGQIGVFTFEDNTQLQRNGQGLFTGGGEATPVNAVVHGETLERSNVDLMQQMVEMMSSQRALQSASQISKMYDQLMTKTTSDLGRM